MRALRMLWRRRKIRRAFVALVAVARIAVILSLRLTESALLRLCLRRAHSGFIFRELRNLLRLELEVIEARAAHVDPRRHSLTRLHHHPVFIWRDADVEAVDARVV